MATPLIIPPINSVGVINLKAPFTGVVAANVPYTVAGLRTLSDIASNGQDPFTLYYEPYGIGQSDYATDLANGVCILSLRSPSDQWVYVPNSYLATAPVATGVPYNSMLVGVNLGALPESLSLAYFMTAVKELAHDLLGIDEPDVKSMINSETVYLSLDDSRVIEQARQVVMGTVVTDRAKLIESERLRMAAVARIAELEAYILAHS